MVGMAPVFGVDAAVVLAAQARAGQRDEGRSWLPYITHPLRVMAAFDDPELQMIAVLHGVAEDTAVTVDDLAAAGASPRVLAAVDILTHRYGEPDDVDWARIAADPDARAVKSAEVADRADGGRLALLDPAHAERLRDEYAKARAALGD